MSVRDRLEDARLLWSRGQKHGAFGHILIAAAATARKRYPLPVPDNRAFKSYIRDVMGVITGGPEYNVAIPFQGSDSVPLEDILYTHIRCTMVHEAGLPDSIEITEPLFEDGRTYAVLKLKDPLGFPEGWIWNLFKAVWDSPENDAECGRGSRAVQLTPDSIDLLLSVDETIPEDLAIEFIQEMRRAKLRSAFERRPNEPYASIMWMAPTLIVVFLAKPYFEELLKLAAKDSYPILKAAILTLMRKAFGVVPETRQRRPSLIFSIYSMTKTKVRVKFVFEEGLTPSAYERCIEQLFASLEQHFADPSSDDALSQQISKLDGRISMNAYLFFNEDTEAWEVVDPIDRHSLSADRTSAPH